jgi:hypothetical protein
VRSQYVDRELARVRYAALLRDADGERLAKEARRVAREPSRSPRLRDSIRGFVGARILRRAPRTV